MKNIFQLFDEILDYPGPQLAAQVDECMGQLAGECPEAADALRRFQSEREQMRLEPLQEAYTSVFDMLPECTLNLGYHLFGEDWRRSVFLARLNELFQAKSFPVDKELPDHLCLILRFLGQHELDSEANDLIAEGVLPALSRIDEGLAATSSPYRFALKALQAWLTFKTKSLIRRPAQTAAAAGNLPGLIEARSE